MIVAIVETSGGLAMGVETDGPPPRSMVLAEK
jgi:hypothetical protein